MSKLNDLTDKSFGRLVVTGRAPNIVSPAGRSAVAWSCHCQCGKDTVVRSQDLRRGDTNSCGCLDKEVAANRFRTHGLRYVQEYQVWKNMISRCHKSTNKHHRDYGGRGIAVCERWRKSFSDFYDDMGSRPSSIHMIDRIDNNGPYEPGNCRWSTPIESARNRRNNHQLSAFGDTKSIAEWAEDSRSSAPAAVIKDRINRLGWNPEDAICKTWIPLNRHDPVTAFGETKTIGDWSRDPRCRVEYFTLLNRIITLKWDIERAIATPSRKKTARRYRQ